MHFKSLRIMNFKAFEDSRVLNLSSGFNLLVGRNNVGKTSLLQAATLRFESAPHKNPNNKPRPTQALNPTSRAMFQVVASGTEIRDALIATGGRFCIPTPANQHEHTQQTAQALLERFLTSDSVTFNIAYSHRRVGGQGGSAWVPWQTPSHGLYTATPNGHAAQFAIRADRDGFDYVNHTTGDTQNSDLGVSVAHYFQSQIYMFSPERYAVGECPFGRSDILLGNASNLPEVLNVMQSIRARFDEFNRLVRLVFPEIFEVTVRPKKDQGNILEILVWMFDPKKERDDLAMTLADCGTGVGQVLALLYVALTSRTSRTILIDEPNSFLHPGAAKKVVELLRQYPHLQYIVSTHSPEIVRVARPELILSLKWTNAGSKIDVISLLTFHDQQALLSELGAGLADVFGADHVLWVEGTTERECFPLVIDALLENQPLGVQIAAIREVSDFEGGKVPPKLVLEVYRKLTEAATMVPNAIAFSFDRELRDESEMSDIRRESGGLAHFLPRRMYENYLLDVQAISALINTYVERKVTPEVLAKWVEVHGANAKYFGKGQCCSIGKPEWVVKVDGGRLLKDLCQDVTEGQLEYRKVTHGIFLTRWLLEHKPASLKELAEYLEQITRATAHVH